MHTPLRGRRVRHIASPSRVLCTYHNLLLVEESEPSCTKRSSLICVAATCTASLVVSHCPTPQVSLCMKNSVSPRSDSSRKLAGSLDAGSTLAIGNWCFEQVG